MADSQKSASDGIVKPGLFHPPIMKIDGPSDEPNTQEIEDNNKNACTVKEGFKMCSSSFRSSVPSTNNPFASTQTRIARGILKPPQLSLNNSVITASKPFILKPSQLKPAATKSGGSEMTSSEKSENGDKNIKQINGEKPKFVPLIIPENKTQQIASAPSKQTSTANSTVSSSNFVFGENLQERAISNESKQDDPRASTSVTSNGTAEMLFSNVIKNEVKCDGVPKDKEVKTLSESAREYEESRANKRKYEEVEVITGEEDENNILKISCKLFAYDKVTGSWQERGRGTLRLNDFEIEDDHIGSRLVFRAAGSLRVILNTKIWAEMTVDKASDKSIRLTALDANGEIKVFLIMANIEDSNKLYSHLQTRLEREIIIQRRKKSHTPAETHQMEN